MKQSTLGYVALFGTVLWAGAAVNALMGWGPSLLNGAAFVVGWVTVIAAAAAPPYLGVEVEEA